MNRIKYLIHDQRGETTINSVLFALIFASTLATLVNFGMYFATYFHFLVVESRAERSMAMHGGFTSEVQEVIEQNLSGWVPLNGVTVIATPYPVNRGDNFELRLQYDFPMGLGMFSGNSFEWFNISLPIRTYAFGESTATIR